MSLEKSLFSWEEWNEYGTLGIQFYKITLKANIGIHKIGQKFEWAEIDFDSEKLRLGNGEKGEDYHLKLIVGAEIIEVDKG